MHALHELALHSITTHLILHISLKTGNPASTFSGFIAKSRLALGFGHSYLFRAKDENGAWRTVCGDHCIFDKSILSVMS